MIPLPSLKLMGREWWWGKNLTSSLWTIYGISLVIRATKLGESASIEGHYTGKTDLKLDPLGFLTLISKLQWCSPF